MHPPLQPVEWGVGVKDFGKLFAGAGVRNFNFGRGSRNFEVKIKTV